MIELRSPAAADSLLAQVRSLAGLLPVRSEPWGVRIERCDVLVRVERDGAAQTQVRRSGCAATRLLTEWRVPVRVLSGTPLRVDLSAPHCDATYHEERRSPGLVVCVVTFAKPWCGWLIDLTTEAIAGRYALDPTAEDGRVGSCTLHVGQRVDRYSVRLEMPAGYAPEWLEPVAAAELCGEQVQVEATCRRATWRRDSSSATLDLELPRVGTYYALRWRT